MISETAFDSALDLANFYRVESDYAFRVNMVVSLDGKFAGPSGRSKDISGPADLRVLLALRLLSDVVLVGAKTAIGEKYRHTSVREDLREIAEHNPRFCLVSSSLELSHDAPIFSDIAHKPTIITASRNTAEWKNNYRRLSEIADIEICEGAELTGSKIRDTLHNRGYKKILCEGGPTLLKTLFSNHVVDELDLTISPTIVGTKPTMNPLGENLQRLQLLKTASVDSFIFNRYSLKTADPTL